MIITWYTVTFYSMTKEQSNPTKLRELDLLKSILETDQGNDTGFVSSDVSHSGTSSRMGDYSSPGEEHVRLSLPLSNQRQGRPKSAKASLVQRKESDNEFIKVNADIRNDRDYSDYQYSSRPDTIHLQHGINYTPLMKRTLRSPRRVTGTKVVSHKGKSKRTDPLLYKYAELQAILSADMPNSSHKGPVLDPYLTRKAQQLMIEYKLAQSGQIPVAWLNSRGVALPTIGKSKGKGKKLKFPRALHAGRQTLNFTSQTQPYLGSEDDRFDDYQGKTIFFSSGGSKGGHHFQFALPLQPKIS